MKFFISSIQNISQNKFSLVIVRGFIEKQLIFNNTEVLNIV